MPTVLITGGAGYLGSAVTAAFLDKGYKVTVLDTFRHGVPSLNHLANNSNLSIVNRDAREADTVRPLIEEADVLVPLAALVGAPACAIDEDYATEINFDAVKLLVEISSKDQLVIYPNTNSGYGIGGKEPCTESTPLKPISHYGRTKQSAEDVVLANGTGVSLRFATLFGPSARMRLDLMVNDFVHRAVTEKMIVLFEGHFRRNFLHVQDAAALFPYMAEAAGFVRGQAFNAGLSSANMTKMELCKEIKAQIPVLHIADLPLTRDPDRRDYIVSNEKLERTGWKAQYSLQSGISSLINCYRQPFANEQWRNA
jgi:nucleoside-diphosphate-sugar epimerase